MILKSTNRVNKENTLIYQTQADVRWIFKKKKILKILHRGCSQKALLLFSIYPKPEKFVPSKYTKLTLQTTM